MDTAAKRASSISVFLPWGALPDPSGSITLSDRQHTGYDYVGIAAVSLATTTDAIFAREWTDRPGVHGWTQSPRLHEVAQGRSFAYDGLDHVPTAAPHGTPEFFFEWWGF